MTRFSAWYTTDTDAEARIFADATEANTWVMNMSNSPGWVAGGTFRTPTRWTNEGALTNAIRRAHRAQESRS